MVFLVTVPKHGILVHFKLLHHDRIVVYQFLIGTYDNSDLSDTA